MIHVLLVVAVIGTSFLIAVGRVVRPIGIDQDALRYTISTALIQIQLKDDHRQAITGLGIDRVLQAAHGWLAGKRRIVGLSATDQLEQRIVPQRVGVVLILITTRDLIHPLPNQFLPAMLSHSLPPLRDFCGKGRTQAKGCVGLGQPGQPTITG
jgi:hypothetical protein